MTILRVFLAFVLVLAALPATGAQASNSATDARASSASAPCVVASDGRESSPAECDARHRWSVEERVTSLLHGDPGLRSALAKRAPERPEPTFVARVDRVEPLQPDVRVEVARDPWDAHEGEVWGALAFGAIAVLASLVQIGIW
ncbi:MAG: hypothetical protein U1F29_05035 [Planctomycetota bacterium]